MSKSLARGLSRWLVAAAVVWGALDAPSAARGQAQTIPVDAYADTQAFIRTVYPDLADRRYVIWFETVRVPMDASVSSKGTFTVFVGPRQAIPTRPDEATVGTQPVLRATVSLGGDGRVSQFSAIGSSVTNWHKSEVILGLVRQHRPTTDEQFRRIIQGAGATFLPGMEKTLLERAGPVIAEVERRFGKLTITDTTPPMLNPADVPASTPSPYLWWSIVGDARMGSQSRQVTMAFDPFEGRLLSLTTSSD